MLDQLFNYIDFSVDWGLLFGLISILSLVFTWIVKSFNDSNKELILKQVSIESLLNKPNELANEIKIILNNQEIEQLNRLELYIQNSGTTTLNASDYHVLPKINLSGFTNIISLSIASSNQFTTCESNKISVSELELKIDNLESKDYIRIEILFESLNNEFESSFEFHLKESKRQKRDLKEFKIDKNFGISKDYNAFMIIPVLAGGIVYGLSYFIVVYGLRIDLSNPDKFKIGWKICFFLPTILTFIYVIYKWNNTIKNFHYGYKEIETWHFTTPRR